MLVPYLFWDQIPCEATEAAIREYTKGELTQVMLEIHQQALKYNAEHDEFLTLHEYYTAYISKRHPAT